jgi:UPF0716 protein FxsA
MIARLFLLFTVVSLVELYLLVWLGGLIGFWPTLAIVMTTALVGATLSKREGLKVMREWQKALEEMRVPREGLTGALLVLVAGIFLITPGILTDVAGLLLLVPPVRRWVGRRIEARFFPEIPAGSTLGDVIAARAAKQAQAGAGPFGARPMGGPLGGPFASGPLADAMRGGMRSVRVETFRVEVGPRPGPRVQVVDHGPVRANESASESAREPEVLEADVVVDRRGRIVHRNEE